MIIRKNTPTHRRLYKCKELFNENQALIKTLDKFLSTVIFITRNPCECTGKIDSFFLRWEAYGIIFIASI